MKKLIKYIKLLIEAIKENTKELKELKNIFNTPVYPLPYIPIEEVKKKISNKPNIVTLYGVDKPNDIDISNIPIGENPNKWEVKNTCMKYAVNIPKGAKNKE